MKPSLNEMPELRAWFLLLFMCEPVMVLTKLDQNDNDRVLTKLDQHVTRSDVLSLIEAEQSNNNVSLLIRWNTLSIVIVTNP